MLDFETAYDMLNKSKEMYTVTETITPERAEQLLKTNPRNRRIRITKKNKIAIDILSGNFELNHQSIAIDTNGMLIDGHHRLEGVVIAQKPVKMRVTYNAPNSTKIDNGSSRSDRDAGYMAGYFDKDSIENNTLTYPIISYIARRNFPDQKAKMLSFVEKHAIYKCFQDEIDTIVRVVAYGNKDKSGRARNSTVMYAMLCALHAGVPEKVLQEWVHIVGTGDFYKENDDVGTRAGRSVLQFKVFLEQNTNNGYYSTKALETLKKAMSSIRHYANRNIITRLYGELCYPDIIIPNELQ